MDLSQFDYFLPEKLIAKRPCSPRENSRMLVCDSDLTDDKFINFTKYLEKNDLIVINNSKVMPILIAGISNSHEITITLHKEINENTWLAFGKPGKRIIVGNEIIFPDDTKAQIIKKMEFGEFKISFNCNKIKLQSFLEKNGKMPLPPYILKKRETDKKDFTDYQTVYAKKTGSIAAPTAGLHFNKKIFNELNDNNQIVEITLHVGAGTFQPIRGSIDSHRMHSEYGLVTDRSAEKIRNCKKNGGRIISVGTTCLRLLEAASLQNGEISSFKGETDIFIKPGFKFKTVDLLLTNFHLPQSTLLFLVAAFTGTEKINKLYKKAIDMKYRFFSYGDVSLLYRND